MSDMIPDYDRDYLEPHEGSECSDPIDYCVDCGAEILPGHACYRIGGKTYCETCVEGSWEIAG